ncbi:MAG TPA: SprT family zinc-dependent metalloprotease [Lachnospiraceae bacterium]|nr:SprT family zinc-dependent metalloprotease [Lachnospiraceae bacterium]
MQKTYLYSLNNLPACQNLTCIIHFSDRKTMGLEIKKDASIHVRAPFYARPKQVEAFILEHKDWILKNYNSMSQRIQNESQHSLTPFKQQKINQLEKRFRIAAKTYIPNRCAELQKLTGGTYHKITIRDQKTRWGSCSQTGTLSFNYRLMMADSSIIDYVIIHELCHLTHMNHSKDFWDMVARFMPDYAQKKDWLKAHGHELTEEHYLLSFT